MSAARLAAALLGLLPVACSPARRPSVAPADPLEVAAHMGLGVIPRAPPDPRAGPLRPVEDGVRVQPLSLQVYPGFRLSGALWLPPGPGRHPAVVVAHGHFGEGKSSGESQGPAWAFARAGYVVLAMDTPGVEEGDLPGRRIHFEAGAHGRALLAAAGTSALAVQVEGLQAALDHLEGRSDVDPEAILAAGASGGAVQVFYLGLVDRRVRGVVLAAVVPMPREARAGGCPCDVLPGWPGPDPRVLAALPVPSLWLTEHRQPPPRGLPRDATWRVVEGPHSFTPSMIGQALAWADRLLGRRRRPPPDHLVHLPPEMLRSPDVGPARFVDLLHPANPPEWSPRPSEALPVEVRCTGEGPRVLVAGGPPPAALRAAGLSPCEVRLEEDPVGLAEAIARGRGAADRPLGALLAAAAQVDASGVYAVRAWGVPASRTGLPWVLEQPIAGPREVVPARDPPWIHAPGIWWRGDPYAGAVARGREPAVLAAALRSAIAPGTP